MILGWADETNGTSCGTACGAQKPEENKPSSCGSACGAGDNK